MKRGKKIEEFFYFTDEEIEFLAKEDLVTFGIKFPGEAEYNREVLSDYLKSEFNI